MRPSGSSNVVQSVRESLGLRSVARRRQQPNMDKPPLEDFKKGGVLLVGR